KSARATFDFFVCAILPPSSARFILEPDKVAGYATFRVSRNRFAIPQTTKGLEQAPLQFSKSKS
ncbi:MAG: hypothetical protein DCC52_16945, partial [Chloroflexi bacterium]